MGMYYKGGNKIRMQCGLFVLIWDQSHNGSSMSALPCSLAAKTASNQVQGPDDFLHMRLKFFIEMGSSHKDLLRRIKILFKSFVL